MLVQSERANCTEEVKLTDMSKWGYQIQKKNGRLTSGPSWRDCAVVPGAAWQQAAGTQGPTIHTKMKAHGQQTSFFFTYPIWKNGFPGCFGCVEGTLVSITKTETQTDLLCHLL